MKLSFFTLIVFLTYSFCLSETKRVKNEVENNWEFEFGLTNQTAGSFYSQDGNKISELPRTFLIDTSSLKFDTIKGRYNFNYSNSIYNFKVSYKINPALIVGTYIPISNYSLDEKGSFNYINTDQYGYQSTSEKKLDSAPTFSKTQLEYLGFGLKYTLYGVEKNAKVKFNLDADFRLPLGKEKQINRTDSINGFVYDGSLEILLNPNITLNFNGFRLFSSAIYQYRNEDLREMIHWNNKFSLTNDPNIDINFMMNYTFTPNSKLTNIEKEFYPRFTPSYEQYADIGAGIKIKFSNSFAFDSGYLIRVYNNHTWNSSTLFLRTLISF